MWVSRPVEIYVSSQRSSYLILKHVCFILIYLKCCHDILTIMFTLWLYFIYKTTKNHFLTFDCDNETSRKILLDLFYTINKQSRMKDK